MSQPWFILVDSDGQPYKGSTVDKISVPPNADVADLRSAIKLECKEILGDITASRLKTFKNKDAFDRNEGHLEANVLVNGLGSLMDEALVIVVPPPITISSAAEGLILFVQFVCFWAASLDTCCNIFVCTPLCMQQ